MISTNFDNFAKFLRNPLTTGIFLVLALSAANFVFYGNNEAIERTPFGGPTNTNEAALLSQGALENPLTVDDNFLTDQRVAGYILVNQAEILAEDNPLKPTLYQKENLMFYEVQPGDTIAKVADKFGVSDKTIMWANNKSNNKLKPGEEIIVLPVSGVVHTVADDETADSIAAMYNVDPQKIKDFNHKISPGVEVIVPDAEPLSKKYVTGSKNPDLVGYFAMPAKGWNWGQLHDFNAVDIANACGTPIYASAEGVIAEEKSDGWNGGYGNYLVIDHPNGTKTLYAHNEDNIAKIGDIVTPATLIAHMGKTGNVTGPTGCHLHFEVHGAVNPFAKD